jgi:hypothetical protein
MFGNPDCVAIKGVKEHMCPWLYRPSSAGAPAIPRATIGVPSYERVPAMGASLGHPRHRRRSRCGKLADERGAGVAKALWLSPQWLDSQTSGRGRRAVQSCAGRKREGHQAKKRRWWMEHEQEAAVREHSIQCKLDSLDLLIPRQSKNNQGCLGGILNYFHLESDYK